MAIVQGTAQINGHGVKITIDRNGATSKDFEEVARWTRDLENRLRSEAGFEVEPKQIPQPVQQQQANAGGERLTGIYENLLRHIPNGRDPGLSCARCWYPIIYLALHGRAMDAPLLVAPDHRLVAPMWLAGDLRSDFFPIYC